LGHRYLCVQNEGVDQGKKNVHGKMGYQREEGDRAEYSYLFDYIAPRNLEKVHTQKVQENRKTPMGVNP